MVDGRDAADDRSWLAELLSDTREVVTKLLQEPLIPLEELRKQLVGYLDALRSSGWRGPDAAPTNAPPLADVELGEALGRSALALLDRVAGADPGILRLAQVAIRYLVLDDDTENDLDSFFGFDDDVDVFNTIATRLGLTDLVIAETL